MKIPITLIFIFYSHYLLCQKYDNNWTFGSPTLILNFDNNTLDTLTPLQSSTYFISSSTVSDKDGNLLFFSDGVTLKDRNGDLIENGNKFQLGHFDTVNYFPGTPYLQGVLLLPMPGSDSLYYYFHQASEDASLSQANHLYYSIIDASANHGKGKVISINNRMFDNFITDAGMGLCKHANGIDWWLIKQIYNTNNYFRFLIKSNGVVEGPFIQPIGVSASEPDWKQQMVFTINGDKMGCNHQNKKGQLFDFDRCTGLLSNPRDFYDFVTNAGVYWGGGAVLFHQAADICI